MVASAAGEGKGCFSNSDFAEALLDGKCPEGSLFEAAIIALLAASGSHDNASQSPALTDGDKNHANGIRSA
jgi:hypothetical protein